jgi:hypothetical protein
MNARYGRTFAVPARGWTAGVRPNPQSCRRRPLQVSGWITGDPGAHAPDRVDYDKPTIVFSLANAPRLAVGNLRSPVTVAARLAPINRQRLLRRAGAAAPGADGRPRRPLLSCRNGQAALILRGRSPFCSFAKHGRRPEIGRGRTPRRRCHRREAAISLTTRSGAIV